MLADGQVPRRRRRGAILIWTAVILSLFIGLVGLTLDWAYVLLVTHQLQNAADAAALAGAQKVKVDQAEARLAATNLAAANKAAKLPVQLDSNDGNASDGDIVIGRFDRDTQVFEPDTENPNAVKVVARRTTGSVDGPLPLLFGPVYGFTTSEVAQDAIAIVDVGPGGPGIILLKPSGEKGLEHTGNGTIIVEGPIHVNSNDPKALLQSGNGVLQATSFEVAGGIEQTGDGDIIGEVNEGVEPVADPYAALPVPVFSEYPIRSSSNLSVGSPGTVTLLPGVYQGGINFSGNGTYNLEPGIYIMEGGGFKVSSNCTLNADAVMVYNSGTGDTLTNADQVLISGDSQVNWTPIPDGTYAGFGIFQNRLLADKKVQISGNGSMAMTGVVYAASAEVQLSGNGTTDLIGGGFVAHSMQISGDGTFSVGVGISGDGTGQSVFLVE